MPCPQPALSLKAYAGDQSNFDGVPQPRIHFFDHNEIQPLDTDALCVILRRPIGPAVRSPGRKAGDTGREHGSSAEGAALLGQLGSAAPSALIPFLLESRPYGRAY